MPSLDAIRARLERSNQALTAACCAYELADRARDRPTLLALLATCHEFAVAASSVTEACAEAAGMKEGAR